MNVLYVPYSLDSGRRNRSIRKGVMSTDGSFLDTISETSFPVIPPSVHLHTFSFQKRRSDGWSEIGVCESWVALRGCSFIRKRLPPGPRSEPTPRALRWFLWERLRISQVPCGHYVQPRALQVFKCVGTGSVATKDTQRPMVVLCFCAAKVAGQNRVQGCWSKTGVSRARPMWWCPAA